MSGIAVECVLDARAQVGEGAIWSQALGRLIWVDIPAGEVHLTDPGSGEDRVFALDRPVGCVAETKRGTLICAMTDGFIELDLDTGAETPICGPAPGERGHRFNDGTTDPRGRFLAGTMPLAGPSEDDATGTVHVFDRGESRPWMDGFHTINGQAFSPDGRTYYASDSFPPVRKVWAWDYDADTGEARNRRLFFDTAGVAGRPDGAAMDADGCYWLAGVGGWQLYRITPEGRLDMTIDLPVERPSRPAFGGAGMDTIFLTSIGVPDDPRQPQAGGIFALRVPGVTGTALPLVR